MAKTNWQINADYELDDNIACPWAGVTVADKGLVEINVGIYGGDCPEIALGNEYVTLGFIRKHAPDIINPNLADEPDETTIGSVGRDNIFTEDIYWQLREAYDYISNEAEKVNDAQRESEEAELENEIRKADEREAELMQHYREDEDRQWDEIHIEEAEIMKEIRAENESE